MNEELYVYDFPSATAPCVALPPASIQSSPNPLGNSSSATAPALLYYMPSMALCIDQPTHIHVLVEYEQKTFVNCAQLIPYAFLS